MTLSDEVVTKNDKFLTDMRNEKMDAMLERVADSNIEGRSQEVDILHPM